MDQVDHGSHRIPMCSRLHNLQRAYGSDNLHPPAPDSSHMEEQLWKNS